MQTPSVGDLTALGAAALEAGDLKTAEHHFAQCLKLAPNDPGALHNLALTVFHAGRLAEAEQFVLRALQTEQRPTSLFLLAEIYENSGRDGEAFRAYKLLNKALPNNVAVLLKLGAMRDKLGDKPGARECYRQAMELEPNNYHAVEKYCDAIWVADPAKSVELKERLLTHVGENLRLRHGILSTLVVHKEWSERIKRGLMPGHATSIDELFYNYAKPHLDDYEAASRQLVAQNPNDVHARVSFGLARFCLRDRHAAEPYLRSGKPDQIMSAIRFAPEFYDELRGYSSERLVQGLPPIIEATPLAPDAAGVLYLSCNFTYFRAFALPMVCSLFDKARQTPVHIHIMDASDNEIEFAVKFCKSLGLPRFAVSAEQPGLAKASKMEARSYYHAIRFIRFHQHLEAYDCPLWLMDVDAVIHRDLAPLFARLGQADVAMRIRPGRLEPWNQFNACVVGASTSRRSKEYFRLIAAYIAHFYQEKGLRWGIDQLAMYGVYEDLADRGEAPTLSLLGEREVDYDYRDDGFVWCNSGAGKFKHLARISNPQSVPLADFGDNKFVPVFEQYWRETERIAQPLSVTS